MSGKPIFFSENDVRVLQGMIDREKRRTLNSNPVNVTDRWDQGEDHQAPEVYVAYPPAGGIPGKDAVDDYGTYPNYAEYENNEVGSAECDIYQIVKEGSLNRLQEVVGLSKTVFNLGDGRISQAFIPVARDKFGRWIALSSGAGVGTAQQIDFIVDAWVPDDAATTGCDAVYATVVQVSCGASVSVGDAVIIYDPGLCWFNMPVNLLVGLRGTALWMESTFSNVIGNPTFCRDAPTSGECLWVVKNICCTEEIYSV